MTALARYHAARYVLGVVKAEQLFDVAQQLLDDGLCSPAIATLVTYDKRSVNLWYLHSKFESLLRELGIPLPNPDEAVWIVLRHVVRCIIEESSPPVEMLHNIWEEFYLPKIGGSGIIIAAAHDFQGLMDYHHAYDEVNAVDEFYGAANIAPASQLLDQEILALATAWNRTHSDPINPAWHTSAVIALAQSICTDRAFDRLPILADALEEAGCSDGAILEHCRGPGPHVRGCWVVDLLLGME